MVWEIEPGAKVIEKMALPDASSLDAARCGPPPPPTSHSFNRRSVPSHHHRHSLGRIR